MGFVAASSLCAVLLNGCSLAWVVDEGWSQPARPIGQPVVEDGVAVGYVEGDDGLMALEGRDAQTGELLWSYEARPGFVARLEVTYNLADDAPAPPQDLVTHGAALLGLEPPPAQDFATAQLTPMQKSFYADNKRVSNGAIKKALGIEMLYPDYRAGLDAILEGEK